MRHVKECLLGADAVKGVVTGSRVSRKQLWLIEAAVVFVTLSLMAGCSLEERSETPKAVEVGNPDDSKPGRPQQPHPLRLLVVELTTKDLKEIEEIRLNTAEIYLVGSTSGPRQVKIKSEQDAENPGLTLRPGSVATISFRIPEDLVAKVKEPAIEISFSEPSPGTVSAYGETFDIEDRSQGLLGPVDLSKTPPREGADFVASRALSKDDLFEESQRVAPVVRPGVSVNSGKNLRPRYTLK